MARLVTHEWSTAPADAGAAAPVAVLVHGVTGWWKTWWRVGPALAERGRRVVAVDQRGHGQSPRIEGVAGVSDWATDLAESIRVVSPEAPVDLVGHSLGAAVSAELASTRPELVRRLVLEDPPSVNRASDSAWLANLDRELRAAATDPEREIARELRENPAWLVDDARQDVEGKRLCDREGILASFRRPTGARVVDVAGELIPPTLYLLGREDAGSVFVGDARRRLLATLPANARVRVLDAGHVLHRDRFDEYVTAIVEWLGDPDRS